VTRARLALLVAVGIAVWLALLALLVWLDRSDRPASMERPVRLAQQAPRVIRDRSGRPALPANAVSRAYLELQGYPER
jgi:hypothetical protein